MKVLITGGAGFIGTNFIHLLMRETNHHVINLDLLTYAGNKSNCTKFENNNRYHFIHGDIADRRTVETVLSDFAVDAIVNFAAESHVDRSIHDASAFIRTNIGGTQTLLDVARRLKISRFIQISTDEVYGELTETEKPFSEKSVVKPSNPYAASKAAADLLTLAAFRTHLQPVIITRCSNNFGPYQYPEKFIPMTIQSAKADKPIPVYGTGQNIRDWIFVEDHCRGILRALEAGKDGEIYNFGSNSERQNREVATKILELLGKSPKLIRFVTDRPGHDFRYAIDFEKAKTELGWEPRVSFETGLARTIEWYNSNEMWLKKTMTPQFSEFCTKHYGDIS